MLRVLPILFLVAAADAQRDFRESLRISPGTAEWQADLAPLLASRGKMPESRFHFEGSVRLKPEYAQERFDYARLLAALGETADAEKHARAAVEAGGGHAGAHQLWVALLANGRELDCARREVEAATRTGIREGAVRARDGALHEGDVEAAEHLRLALKAEIAMPKGYYEK